MKKTLSLASLLLAAAITLPAGAEQDLAPKQAKEQTQAALDKLKADKKFLTTKEMQLTESESKVFWPLYDEYQAGLQGINQRLMALLDEYAALYRTNTMTDDKANKLLANMMAIESDELALKKAIIPKLQKVLPGVKVARYIQVENKMRALLKIQLGDKIPLVK